jgi:RNA polymerase sigma factor (sigma-70 family)
MPAVGRPPDPRRIDRDAASFTAFYLAHFDGVLRFVTRRVDDPHTAADLTADVFLNALDHAASYRGDGAARAWLYGIARNVISGEYRRATRERGAANQLSGRQLLNADDTAALDERIDAERAARQLREGLAHLPPTERDVIELIVVDQLTVTEAAHVLGIRPATARVRLFRARRALRGNPQQPHPIAVPTGGNR